MTKGWMSAIVVAGLLGLANTASAQYLPDGQPGAPLADPVPSATTLSESATPGPLTGYLAPYGPSEDLALPANHSNAYPTCPRYEPEFYFFHAGTLALKRQRLGNGIVAFTDRSNPSRLDTGRLTLATAVNPVLNLDDLDPQLAWGGTATLGYMFGSYSFELSGMWLPQSTVGIEATDIGRLNTFFFNSPLGFDGNNNLFRQADYIRQEFTSEMIGGEFNVRYFTQAYQSVELLMGFRYLNYVEHLNIIVDDDRNTFLDILGQPSPLRLATYTSRTINRIFGPQLGMEYQTHLCQGVALGAYAKAAAGVNVADVDLTLRRGDSLVGFSDTRSEYTFAGAVDLGVYADVYYLERLRLRTGYQLLALTGILESPDQIDYDLNQVGGRRDVSGSAIFQGFTIQLQFLF